MALLDDERRAAEQLNADAAARIAHHADRAAQAARKTDRLFWIVATANSIIGAAEHDHEAGAEWLRFAAERIHVTTSLSTRDRLELIRHLARRILPVG
jgi:hypothetical protein